MDSKSLDVSDGTFSILFIDSEGTPQILSKEGDPFDISLWLKAPQDVPNYIGTVLRIIFYPVKIVIKLLKIIFNILKAIPKIIKKLIQILFSTIHKTIMTIATAMNLPFLMIHAVMVCVVFQRIIVETGGTTTQTTTKTYATMSVNISAVVIVYNAWKILTNWYVI